MIVRITIKLLITSNLILWKHLILFLISLINQLICLAIIAAAIISKDVIVDIIRRIFSFMPSNILRFITSTIDTLIYTLWIILGCIIFVRVFKTRYLDYYIVISDDSVKEKVIEEPIKELKERKEYKIVIRDPEHSSLNFMKKIGKAIMFMFKCFCIFISLPIIVGFIFMVIALVISLSYLFSGLFFNGISLAILGGIIFI